MRTIVSRRHSLGNARVLSPAPLRLSSSPSDEFEAGNSTHVTRSTSRVRLHHVYTQAPARACLGAHSKKNERVSEEIWATLNIEASRADEGEARKCEGHSTKSLSLSNALYLGCKRAFNTRWTGRKKQSLNTLLITHAVMLSSRCNFETTVGLCPRSSGIREGRLAVGKSRVRAPVLRTRQIFSSLVALGICQQACLTRAASTSNVTTTSNERKLLRGGGDIITGQWAKRSMVRTHPPVSVEDLVLRVRLLFVRGNSSISGRVTPDFRTWESVPDDAVCRWVFSGISRFPRPFIPVLLHTHLNYPHRLSRPGC
ncbi:hypothetical protein PR048_009958 [Dryococelus australis]|uniref:Uncharacterized protein n=1 Tax=Dryococelus australis TaxID=614101 RepID=A0ABQ9I1E9_9NEOP|nr:hypothetical protein PR048_009958 [Dryococelus australis]